MTATLRGYWTDAAGYQSLLYFCGLVLWASAAVHGVAFFADNAAWEGPVSWRKPILFGFSFGVTAITIGWIMGFLRLRPWLGWTLSTAFSVASLGEVGLVSMQQWRGVASHFNVATSFDSAVFGLMGLQVVIIAVVILLVTLLSFRRMEVPPSMAWAIRIGLIILLGSQAVGGMLIANGVQVVVADGGFRPEALGDASTLGEAGAGKVPHALTLHAAQVLPGLAWFLAFARLEERRRLRIILTAAAGYASLTTVSILQAFSGRATFNLTNLTITLAAIGLVLLSVGSGATVAAFVRSRFSSTPSLDFDDYSSKSRDSNL